MDEKILESHFQLKKFISSHQLSNQNSIVYFYALINIKTENGERLKVESKVRVNFDVGNRIAEISLEDNNFDTQFYPTYFFPDYQTITYENNSFLKIEGKHTTREVIGNYIVEIYPIGNVSEK